MRPTRFAIAALGLVVAAGPAGAQDISAAKFLDCAQIGDSLKRLICYDEAVGGLRKQGGELAVTNSTTDAVSGPGRIVGGGSGEVDYTNYSYTPPAARSGAGAGGDVEGTFPVSIITRIGTDIVVRLENGQVWRQTDGKDFNIPRSGTITAQLTPGFQSSHFMTVQKNGGDRIRQMRVKRLR